MNSKDHNRERQKYEYIWTLSEYKELSPGLMAIEHFNLDDVFIENNVQSILDAGCGDGQVMKHLINMNHFDLVHGFDIAFNCLDQSEFDTKSLFTLGPLWESSLYKHLYDAIICIDVLEHIPEKYIQPVMLNFFKHTQKICFLGIALFPDYFGPKYLGTSLHLTIKQPDWWLNQIEMAGFKDIYYKCFDNAWLYVYLPIEDFGSGLD